jgi:hypothetical protein
VELPESLPARLYLLAYDKRRQRLAARTQLGHVLRAAALADLELRGSLTDEDGKVRVVVDPPVGDPVLDAALEEIAGSRPRTWGHWVRAGQRAIKRAVRDQLEAGRWIRVEPRRVLGLFPSAAITLRDPRALTRLTERGGSAAPPSTGPSSWSRDPPPAEQREVRSRTRRGGALA